MGSANDDHDFPNSHHPETHGLAMVTLRAYTRGMAATCSVTLVAVEWVVPGAPTDEPPELFGEHFHYNPTLGIWALHAWLFKRNPSGMFADWNPNVGPCPSS